MSLTSDPLTGISGVLARMDVLLDTLPPELDTQATFLDTYRRTTVAVGEQVEQGRFEDPGWVDRWDVAFADLYLDALDADAGRRRASPRPWRLAFERRRGLPPLRHVLLGINAHINYDLPQSLLAVIGRRGLRRPRGPGPAAARPRADRRDPVRPGGGRGRRALLGVEAVAARPGAAAPQPGWASKRFLREARQKVWHNTLELHAGAAGRPEASTRHGWPSSRSSAPPRSPTCSRRGRCCSGWPSAASA